MLITNSFFEFSYLRNGVWDKFVNKLESKTIDGLKARLKCPQKVRQYF